MMNLSLNLLALLSLVASLGDASKTFSMRMYRRERSAILKRDTLPVDIGNAQVLDGLGLYYVNASVGTPPQLVQLQIDTGSSDVWFFGPDSCDSTTSPCVGGIFDPTQSSSFVDLAPGQFSIQYETPNSGVTGDYISDNFAIGGVTISNLTMALATKAQSVPTGIMGIGFDTDESIVSNGGQSYPSIIDTMVSENIIGSKSYSLYLDDLTDSTGTVLFGGYDTDKFTGDLTILDIQPDAQSGAITSMTVAWTSLSVTDNTGASTTVSASDFPLPAVLDSGTTLTVIPPDLFSELADYFGAVSDPTYGVLVQCNISQYPGSLDFGFGGDGGAVISVSYGEFALPLTDNSGNPLTFDDGSTACQFGLDQTSEGEPVLLGDTFLRSAYVVYDLDNQQIGLAQTNFESTSSNIVEIGGSGSVAGASSVASAVTVKQTATAKQPLTIVESTAATATRVQATHSSAHLGFTSGGTVTKTGSASSTGTTPAKATKNAAATLSAPFDRTNILVVGSTFGLTLLGGVLMLFA